MITINNLTKKFGSITVLDDISIHFGKAKVYGIVGENGSGKTTLFRCIAELEKFEGTIVSELTPLRQQLGYIMAEQFFEQEKNIFGYCWKLEVKKVSILNQRIFSTYLSIDI